MDTDSSCTSTGTGGTDSARGHLSSGGGSNNSRKSARPSGGIFSGLTKMIVPSVFRPGTSSGAGGSGEGRGSGFGSASGRPLSIYDSLCEFFSVEDLGGDNCYRCDKCKTLQRAKKHLRALALPPILSLHLKRFRYGFSAKKAAEKVSPTLPSNRHPWP